jgi:hypothetical protein
MLADPSSAGFANISNRYYVWPLTAVDPIIITSECQFREFMADIMSLYPQLNLLDSSTLQEYRNVDLLIDFPEHPRFTPRYLGVAHTLKEYHSLLRQLPSKDFRTMDEPNDPVLDQDDIETFNSIARGQIKSVSSGQNGIFGVNKKDADYIAKKKQQKKESQIAKKKAMNEMFKRAQQYFGLRPSDEASLSLPKINPAAAIPYPLSRDFVLICFDVESWERNHNIITEVGLAIFDTAHLRAHPAPGLTASNWHNLIEAHHFRIIEHSHHRNGQFVAGNPFGFKFGDSQDVSIDDASLIIEEMFDYMGADKEIVLVGHAVAGDIRYLDKLGFNPTGHQAAVDTLDTQNLWSALNSHNQESGNIGLSKLLAELKLSYSGLHNAGNDAVYTMHCLLAMMVLEGTLREGA